MKKSLLMLLLSVITALNLTGQETKKYNDKQNMPVVLEQEAFYPDGLPALFRYFRENIQYSQDAIDNKVFGEVMVSFDVLPDSSLKDITVLSGVGFGVDEEVVRLFKPLKYAPSVQNGVALKMNVIVTVPVRARYKLPE